MAHKHSEMGDAVKGLDQLQCAQCGKMFTSRNLLKRHIVHEHQDGLLACEKCKRTFKHKRNYILHLNTALHLEDELTNVIPCKDCNKTFTNLHNLKTHMWRTHITTLQECTFCPYKTKDSSNMKRHLAFHCEKPKFICDRCGLKFRTKNALQDHDKLVHCNTRDFSCDRCGKQFHRSSELNRHVLVTHTDIQHTCHCGNKYKTLYNLRRHQVLAHGSSDTSTRKHKQLIRIFPIEKVDHIPKKKMKRTKLNPDLNNKKPDVQNNIPKSPKSFHEANVIAREQQSDSGILQMSYVNMDFSEDNKSHVYSQHFEINRDVQVEESVIQLDDLVKEGAGVLTNMKNIVNRSSTNNDYIIENPMTSSVMDGIDVNQHIASNTKQGTTSSLQEYIISDDLNFLTV